MKAMLLVALSCLLMSSITHAKSPDGEWPPKGTLVVDAVVAVVGSEPITLYEFQRAAAPYIGKFRNENVLDDPAKIATEVKKIRDDVIETLIANKLIRQEALKLDIKISQDQVDAQLNQVKNSNGWDDDDLTEAVGRLGFDSLNAYRQHVRSELLKNRVIGIKVSSKIRVDKGEAERRYKKTYGTSGSVEERRLAHILIRVAELAPKPEADAIESKLKEIQRAIAAGESSFEEMARQHSQDPTSRAGGDLGWITQGDTDPDFEKAAFQLASGEVSAPVRTSFGLHLIKVVETRTKQTIDAEKKKALMRQLQYRMREEQLKRLYKEWIDELRKGSHVEIKPILNQALPVQ